MVPGRVFFVVLELSCLCWNILCHPGIAFVILELFSSPSNHLHHPGNFFVFLDSFSSSSKHLCHPGFIFIVLKPFLSSWMFFFQLNYGYFKNKCFRISNSLHLKFGVFRSDKKKMCKKGIFRTIRRGFLPS